MSDQLLAAIAEAPRYSVKAWFGSCAVIRFDDGMKKRAPKPNILQSRMFDHYEDCQSRKIGCRMIILKPRRKGASTAAQAVCYHHGKRHHQTNGTTMGDKDGTTDEIYEIYRTYAENDNFDWGDSEAIAPRGKPGNSETDIIIPGGSRIGKETAGSSNAGRGGTRQVLNITECAHYTGKEKNPTLALLPSCEAALKSPRGLIIADSTPNGPQGWFYNTCKRASKGIGGWKLIFAAWFEFENSTLEFESTYEREAFMRSLDLPENAWYEERKEIHEYGISGQISESGSPEGITAEHLHWRRMIINDFCDGSLRQFRQEYPSDPEECFNASAEKKFNQFHVKRCTDLLPSFPERRFTMDYDKEAKMVNAHPDPTGEVKIFEEPRIGCYYVGSGDFCTGEDQQIGGSESDPDYHSLQIWRRGYFDNDIGKWRNAMLVAHHHSRIDIDLAAYVLAAMSHWYGRCFIVPEVNNCGGEPTRILVDLGFNVFERTNRDQTTNQINKAHGWSTDKFTRKTVVDHFGRAWRDGEIDIFDKTYLHEIKSFVENKAGRPEAMAGEHDDTILSGCLAFENISNATLLREPRRRSPTLAQLKRNPRLMCPEGYRRGGFDTHSVDMRPSRRERRRNR